MTPRIAARNVRVVDTRILIVGYGRMGRLVEKLAPECGCVVGGILDIDANSGGGALGDLVRRAVVDSDSAATDVLVARLGGPPAIQRVLDRLGIGEVRFDRDERRLQTEIHGLVWRPEYVDAARLEGSSEVAIWCRVVLPQVRPTTFAVGMLATIALASPPSRRT